MEAKLKSMSRVLGLPVERLPAAVLSLVLAELFFKFHSFTLECLAFLALWRGLDVLQGALRGWEQRSTALRK